MLGLLDQAALMKDFRRDLVTSLEILFDLGKADLDPFFLKNVRKAALWQTTLLRHLSALKTRTARVARTRFLALVPTAGRFA